MVKIFFDTNSKLSGDLRKRLQSVTLIMGSEIVFQHRLKQLLLEVY